MSRARQIYQELEKLRTIIAAASTTITSDNRNRSGLLQKEHLLTVSETTLGSQRQQLEDLKEQLGDENSGVLQHLKKMREPSSDIDKEK